jgi:proteasome lid subunit RPN8/RPN11
MHECQQFSLDYFWDAAQRATERLVADGKVAREHVGRFAVFALPKSADPASEPIVRSSAMAAAPRRMRLRSTTRDLLFDDVSLYGETPAGQLPAIVPQRVLDEMVALHERAGDVETGGVLVGHLHRDTNQSRHVTIEITGQLPARYATEERTRLTFLPDTWAEVDRLLKLRGLDEIKLGWWHSHPARAWCAGCSEDRRRVCPLNREFFSAHDAALHRVCFLPAYCVAIVVSDTYAHGLSLPMYGWRAGRVVERGYHIRAARTGLNGPHRPITPANVIDIGAGGTDDQPCS